MLKASSFLGEGDRKVTVRLAAKQIPVGGNRVLSLMDVNGCWCRCDEGIPAESGARPCGRWSVLEWRSGPQQRPDFGQTG